MVRTMLVVLAATALTAAALPVPVPAEAQACSTPNVPATTLRTVPPEMPAMAQQQGIEGTVAVIVSLDEQSHLVGAKIQSSPSMIFNQPALSVVRHTAFRTETRACSGVARDFVFTVEFEHLDELFPGRLEGPPSAPVAVVSGQGETTVAPDVAVVHAVFVTRDADRQRAVAANDAAVAAFRSGLSAHAIPPASVETGYYNLGTQIDATGPARVTNAVASHDVLVTVTDFGRIRDVLAAAATAGATEASLTYSASTSGAAYQSAKVTALRNAAAEANRVAAAHRLRGGEAVRTHVTNSSTESNDVVKLDTAPERIAVPAARPIAYRVNMTVTYALKP